MSKLGISIYNILLALWVGGIAIFSFLITPVIFKGFERDTASAIVDKLFPFYFPYNLIISIAALLCFFFFTNLQSGISKKISLGLIIAAIVINAFITFKIYPDVKKVKATIASFEQTSSESLERKEFRKLHGISAVLNLLLLIDGIALIVISSVPKE
ncbi:MAG: DUF4149 domain-containing protein [Thermodesulfovibrionia bacterium]|nr:DUF4149 domain-containing protein [Thermodesulfovibrionia bacterium]